MLYDSYFKNPGDVPALLDKIRVYTDRSGPIRLMEICGTHTMAIARSGLRSLLPPSVTLLSGPGCPVCVTPAQVIDCILSLSQQPGILVASYGDLLRVPGSARGDSLLRRRASGGHVLSVYSPMDALEAAAAHPETEIIFLGVGFETTAPGTAACILEAAARGIPNFSVLCLLKQTEPALRALIEADDFAVDGFLCPGHVAAILGANAFSFLPDDYRLPGVVSGFEPADLLYSVLMLAQMLAQGRPALQNEYTRLVQPDGNPAAKSLIEQVFAPAPSDWRGLGHIPASGYAIRPAYARWDAAQKFGLRPGPDVEPPGCRCAQVIRGVLHPSACPLFGRACTPQDPVGPCMVSGEGACAAWYQYGAKAPGPQANIER